MPEPLRELIESFGDDLPESCRSLAFWRELCAGIVSKARTHRVQDVHVAQPPPAVNRKPRVAQPPPAVNEDHADPAREPGRKTVGVVNRKDAA